MSEKQQENPMEKTGVAVGLIAVGYILAFLFLV